MSELPPLPATPPGRYRHYKGGEYEVIGAARHSETLEPLVVYRPLYNATGLWVRPHAMFFGSILADGRQQPRFAPVLADPWLTRWLPLALERAGDGHVLEIGCGHGEDTAVLVQAGLRVQAFDLSPAAIETAKLRVPAAQFETRDARAPLPVLPSSVGVVVASLSLHYFPWAETQAIVGRIRDALRPGGLLLCRLNSTQDHHFGASGHLEIEPGLFMVDGSPKRFFDREAVDALFANGWTRRSAEHFETSKYGAAKALWEVVLERA